METILVYVRKKQPWPVVMCALLTPTFNLEGYGMVLETTKENKLETNVSIPLVYFINTLYCSLASPNAV